MSKIRSKNTSPELLVRSLVYKLGFRYRLHAKDLPGRPDIVFRTKKKAIFVHGCFWHFHDSCREGRIPSTRRAYWFEKLQKTKLRDIQHQNEYAAMGWKTLILWECELSNPTRIETQLKEFLTS